LTSHVSCILYQNSSTMAIVNSVKTPARDEKTLFVLRISAEKFIYKQFLQKCLLILLKLEIRIQNSQWRTFHILYYKHLCIRELNHLLMFFMVPWYQKTRKPTHYVYWFRNNLRRSLLQSLPVRYSFFFLNFLLVTTFDFAVFLIQFNYLFFPLVKSLT
jgi:hypothetical protein